MRTLTNINNKTFTKYLSHPTLAVVLLLFFCFPNKGTAQQELGLSKAIQLSLMNNFEIKIAEQNELIAASNKRFGVAERYPRIRFNLDQYNRLSLDTSPTSFVDGAYTKNELSAGLDLSWVLFEGFQVRINKGRLNQLEEQSQGNVALVVQNTIHAVILVYYKAMIEKEKLNAVEESLKFSNNKLTNGRILFDSGNTGRYDLLNLENAFLADSVNLQNQTILYNEAMVQLNFIMGANKNKQYKLVDELYYENNMLNYSALEKELVKNNLDIKSEYINLKLAETKTALINAARKPSISLRSGLSEEISTSKFAGDDRDNGSVFDYYISFSLSYTLFDGRKMKQELEEAKIQEQVAHLTIADQLMTIKEELLTNYNKYQQYAKIMRIQDRLIKNLEENLSIVKDRYDNGYSIFIEYRDAQLTLLEAKLNKLETIYEIKIAETEIIRLTGGLLKMEKGKKSTW